MTEEFLHYIWKFRLFDAKSLITSLGEKIKIFKPGEHNIDAGPDFFNAQIKIENTLWAGNVEIHIKSSDWKKHRHEEDKSYDNIILHVVYEADKNIFRRNGEVIPTLELKNLFSPTIYKKYLQFKSSKDWVPCEKQISKVDRFIVNNWLGRLVVERLERKSLSITQSLKLNKNNWEETFYQQIARNFGFKVNAEPFELLAKSISNKTLAKHKNSLLQIEAMLFGQAGMLEKEFKDSYPQLLQKEYAFLKQKFNLKPLDRHLWKFLRFRPSNFPTIRISQFSNLVYKSSHLFSKILETEHLKELKLLLDVEVSEYWRNHYVFDKSSVKKNKDMGGSSIDVIIVNTVIPFLFVYGKQKGEEMYSERAITFLENMEGEKNSVINQWEDLLMPVSKAFNTQALLQLKNEYCSKKRCVDCQIGNYLIKNS